MSAPVQHLRRWQEAGFIDEATAARIRAFEGEPTGPEDEFEVERPTFTEALLYLGIVVIAVGVIVLAVTNWGHLGSWGRIAVPGVPGIAALLGGRWMRRQPGGAVQRGASAAWMVTPGLLTGALAIALDESGRFAPETIAMLSGLFMAAVAGALWLAMKRTLQVLAVAGAGVHLSLAASAEMSRVTERWAPTAGGLTMLGIGAAGFAAVELGFIRPQIACRLIAALALVMGAFFVSVSAPVGALEVAPFAAGAALVWAAVALAFFPYTVAGIAGVFLGTTVTILKHVPDPTVAALALMFAGVILIAIVVLLARMRQLGGTTTGLPTAT